MGLTDNVSRIGENLGPDTFNNRFARKISKHNISVRIQMPRRTSVLEKIMQKTTFPLDLGRNTDKAWENHGEHDASNLVRKLVQNGSMQEMLPMGLI